MQYLQEIKSTGLKNETHVAKIKISPILSNRPNVLLCICKLEPPLEEGGKKEMEKAESK